MSKQYDIAEATRRNLEQYLKHLDGEIPSGLYDMVIQAVEKPMLEVIMEYADQNQSLASQILGINRNTLRKKLQLAGLL